jgi:predicted metalloprotease with PDZ domain
MKFFCYFLLLFLCIPFLGNSQETISYTISFENAEHHEAFITAEFNGLDNNILELRMSRTSPGRYALHEFAKNVYDLKAYDSKGISLPITRPNPHQWNIANHDGTVKVTYILFANRGDGTYSQVDLTHAHLNIPATFVYSKRHRDSPINITILPREDLNWKIATQLKHVKNHSYFAPDLYYFMDSPVEISDHSIRTFELTINDKTTKIKFVLHSKDNEQLFDTYFEKVKKIVAQEKMIFGELPEFDYGTYTFLACYLPNVSGDGMEHRNSTILTSKLSLEKGGIKRNIGTVAHELFHAWNVERIRPKSLEPFNFEEANISGELWFAEGFTSYYGALVLCRAGIVSQKDYVDRLAIGLNAVWNSPARNYFNPIEMSYQAPFVDAARSVDPVNRENNFISYYTYGNVLGLALDLSLRKLKDDKNLDGYMKLVWQAFGKSEIPYKITDLQNVLKEYAGKEFSDQFFSEYIYSSKMPDYKALFATVGISLEQNDLESVFFGAALIKSNKHWVVRSNPIKGASAYNAGLNKGDIILSIDDIPLHEGTDKAVFFTQFKPQQKVKIIYLRNNEEKEAYLVFTSNNSYTTTLTETKNKKILENRNFWLTN